MEFEKNAPVSDEQRRLAESKKIVVEPAHTNIVPDDVSDSEIANSHINGQPIANSTNDTEQTAPTLPQANQPSEPNISKSHKHPGAIMFVVVGLTGIIIATGLYVVLRALVP